MDSESLLASPVKESTASLLGLPGTGSSTSSLGFFASRPVLSRYWVLAICTLLASQQSMLWALPGTLQPNYQLLYGLSQDTIQLLLNYGPIFFILAALPSMYALDRVGLRWPVLACTLMLLLCSALHCAATSSSTLSLVCVHASCLLSAVAGPIAMALPSKLAQDFFPPLERTRATAIAALGSQCGAMVTSLLLPLLCPTNSPSDLLQGMRAIHLIMLGISLLTAAMAALHMPSLPATPPSPSALLSREQQSQSDGSSGSSGSSGAITLTSLWASLRAFYSCPPYLAIVLTYALVAGANSSQGAMLTQNLALLGASEGFAGWCGAAASLGGLLLGLGAAGAGDALKATHPGGLKALLLAATLASAAGFTVFAAASQLGWSLWLASAAYCAGFAALSAQVCLSFDIAAESVWGLGPEGTMLMGIVVPVNVSQVVAFLVPQGAFFAAVNWGVAGCALASVPVLAAYIPSSFKKLRYDLQQEQAGKGQGAQHSSIQDTL